MKNILIFALVFTIFATTTFALEPSVQGIKLYTPTTNATMTGASQEFVFSIQAPENAKKCDLLANDKIVKSYASEINKGTTNRFIVSLPTGEYSWKITCTLLDDTALTSETRLVKISAPLGKSCVEKISKGSGSYRYVFTLGCINTEPVIISEARPNDWIEFHLKAESRIAGGAGFNDPANFLVIYVLTLSKKNGIDFIEVNSDTEEARQQVMTGQSIDLTAGQYTLNLTLDKVVNKKARLIISLNGHDYAASVPTTPTTEPNTTTAPTEPTTTEPTTTDTTGTTETTTTTPATPPEQTEGETTTEKTLEDGIGEETPPADSAKTWVTIVIISILAIIVIYLFFSTRKDKKKEGKTDETSKKKKKEEIHDDEKEENSFKDERKDKKGRDIDKKADFMIEVGDMGKRKK